MYPICSLYYFIFYEMARVRVIRATSTVREVMITLVTVNVIGRLIKRTKRAFPAEMFHFKRAASEENSQLRK